MLICVLPLQGTGALREGVHRITLQTEDSKSSVDSITVTVYP